MKRFHWIVVIYDMTDTEKRWFDEFSFYDKHFADNFYKEWNNIPHRTTTAMPPVNVPNHDPYWVNNSTPYGVINDVKDIDNS